MALWAWTLIVLVFNSTQCLTIFHHLELMPTFEKTFKKKMPKKWDETEEWLEKY